MKPTFADRSRSLGSVERLEPRLAPAGLGLASAQEAGPTPATTGDELGAPGVSLDFLHDDVSAQGVTRGGSIEYELGYSNSLDVATSATFHHKPDPLVAFDAAHSTPGWRLDPDTGTYSLQLTNIPAHIAGATVIFAVTVDAELPASQLALSHRVTLEAPVQSEGTPVALSLEVPIYKGIAVYSHGESTPGRYAFGNVRVVGLGHLPDQAPHELTIRAYGGPKGRDSVRTAVADFNGDGYDDVLTIPEHATGAVKIFDVETGRLLDSPLVGLRPFGQFQGAFVAVAEAQGAVDTVIFGSAAGGGAVKLYSPGGGAPERFYPFGRAYTAGVRVATGDVDGDGVDDLIVAGGSTGNQVKVYHSADPDALMGSFRVGGARYNSGLTLAAGDLDNDGRAEIVTGRNLRSAPLVEVFSFDPIESLSGTTVAGAFTPELSFEAFNRDFRQGVRPALADYDLDGNLDIIAAVGFDGRAQAKVFSLQSEASPMGSLATATPTQIAKFQALPLYPKPGIWVSATSSLPRPTVTVQV